MGIKTIVFRFFQNKSLVLETYLKKTISVENIVFLSYTYF